jgi:hypothetical protein
LSFVYTQQGNLANSIEKKLEIKDVSHLSSGGAG